MGFFKKSRVKQEVTTPEKERDAEATTKIPRLSVRQFKRQKKNDRKANVSDYASKKAARSSKIDALLEQRAAHRQGSTARSSNRNYDPTPAPSRSLKQASDIGMGAASIAAKQTIASWWN